jgi:ribosomal protein S18 acetylase RimI-like enzyme
MEEVIWRSEARSARIVHRRDAPSELIALLERTSWGERDVKYLVRQVADVLLRIPDPHIFVLEGLDGTLIGGLVCGLKTIRICDRAAKAAHIAMIAIEPAQMGRGFGPLLAKRARECLLQLVGDGGVVYAYVEATHVQSVELHRRLGYRVAGTARARIITRVNPRDRADVRLIRPDEAPAISAELARLYDQHLLADFGQSVLAGEYYVAQAGREIVAGAQVSKMHWSLEALDGLGGFVTLQVLPRLPIIGRGFDPRDVRFLRIGNIILRHGHEQALSRLLETLLARHDVNAGVIFLDDRSPVHRSIAENVRFGAFSGLVRGAATVLVEVQSLTEAEQAWVLSRPIHVSPIDAI